MSGYSETSSGHVRAQIRANGPKGLLAKLARERLEKARSKRYEVNSDSLLDFIPSVSPDLLRPYYLKPFTDLLEQACEPGGIRAVIAAPPQHGKALECSTILPTYERGLVEAGTVRVGEHLIGSDGQWTTVTGVFPQGIKPLFRVGFTDCSSLVTCGEHLWEVRQRYGGPSRVKQTSDLATDLTESDARQKWRIPIVKPIAGKPQDLPIDPYWLGLWLGDGTSSGTSITSMDEEIADYIRSYAARIGLSTRKYDNPNVNNRASLYTIYSEEYRGNHLKKTMESMGLIGNKHIPEAYLLADKETRLALLQGLSDTDGTVAKNGSQQSFCTTSPALLSGFRFLVASLGGVCTIIEKKTYRKLAYNVYFRLPDGMPGFRLSRKQDRLTAYTPRHEPRRWVKSVEPVGTGEAVCFTVAAADSLFCAGPDLVVTHNSVSALHGLLWLAIKYPGLRHAYITYSKERADYVSRQFQVLADSIGLEPDGRLSDVRLKGGTEVRFTSIGGSLTGFSVDGLLLVDDPVKDRADAESPTIRRTAAEWFVDVARSRRHPKTSIICMATRWHPEDLSGELIASGYPYINLKAIAEGPTDEHGTVTSDPLLRKTGQSLFPEFKPPNFFQEERKDEYSWNSLYQGEPRGRGSYVFQWLDTVDQVLPGGDRVYSNFTYAPHIPVSAYERMSIGIDFAYTAKTSSDYSVAVVIGEIGDRLHVVDVVRLQVETRHFRERLILLKAQYPIATMTAYVAATEQGGVEFIREAGISIKGLIAKQDKFMRAVPVAAAWNSGLFKLPQKTQWLDTFTAEVCSFTGLSDRHDDQVDAFAAAFDGLGQKPSAYRPRIQGGVDVEYRSIGMG